MIPAQQPGIELFGSLLAFFLVDFLVFTARLSDRRICFFHTRLSVPVHKFTQNLFLNEPLFYVLFEIILLALLPHDTSQKINGSFKIDKFLFSTKIHKFFSCNIPNLLGYKLKKYLEYSFDCSNPLLILFPHNKCTAHSLALHTVLL